MLAKVTISIGNMQSRNRLSVAELYVGVFQGEIKGLSLSACRVHFATVMMVSLLSFIGVYKSLISPYWLPSTDAGLSTVELIIASSRGGQKIEHSLPHRMTPLLPQSELVSLAASFEMQGELHPNSALYIPIHQNRVSVFVNNIRLLPSTIEGTNPLAMWRRSSLFLLPYGLLKEKDNSLTIKLHGETESWMEMSRIYVGSHLPLQRAYNLNSLVSYALMWLMLLGSLWAVASVMALLYVGGSRFLLAILPLSCTAILFGILQLSETVWVVNSWHVVLWYLTGMSIVILGSLVGRQRWRSYTSFRISLILLLIVSGAAFASVYTGLFDTMVLAWWLMLLMTLSITYTGTLLFGSVLKKVLREQPQSLNPFLIQVINTYFVMLLLSWVLLFSMLGLFPQIPLVTVNVMYFMMPFNMFALALLAALSRTQELADYRANLRSKVESQERHLWSLNHHHLEAMRWTVIGQSARTLVERIGGPLQLMGKDLAILRFDSKIHRHQAQWHRLKRCTDRCVEHVKVIEALVQDDDIRPRSLRMDQFVRRCLYRLQDSYTFKWQLCSDVRGWVETDEHYLSNVVESLVDNANHAAIAAGRALELLVVLDRDGDDVRLSIQDNGTGIDKSVNVFRPFHSSRAFGLGLGVNLAQKHLNAMGGRLTQESCDTGAKFCIHLPVGTVP